MKKEVLLVLGILEGQSWQPVEGHRTYIEAHLDNNKLLTQPIPLTNSPKFNTEITWEAEKQTIRSYKINRIPIKIECFSVDENNKKQLLGYVVLPLTSAVEGVPTDANWHKLLGGSNIIYKSPPSILLQLHLESMNLNQVQQVNGKQMPSVLKNASSALEEERMPSYSIEKELNSTRKSAQVNGNGNGYRHTGQSNGVHAVDDLVASADEIELDNVEEDKEGEDYYDYLSDVEKSFEEEDGDMGMIMEAYSLSDKRVQKNETESHLSGNEVINDENLIAHSFTNEKYTQQSSNMDLKARDNTSDINESPCMNKEFSEDEILMHTRNSTREQLQNISQSIYDNSKLHSKPMRKESSNHPLLDLNSYLEGRISDTAKIFDVSFKHKNKTRKLDSTEISRPHITMTERKIDKKSIDSIRNCNLKASLAYKSESASAAILLSQSLEGASNTRTEKPTFSAHYQTQSNFSIKPVLNQNEGYFSIGPLPGEKEDKFTLSVTIIYAKYLNKVIPSDFISPFNPEYRFRYSLLGHWIVTDPFSNLSNPEFLAEKASAKIHSSHESLAKFFTVNYYLQINFASGDTDIGVSTIDLSQLVEIARKSEAKVEGIYEIDSLKQDITQSRSSSKAVVAVSISLIKSFDFDDVRRRYDNASHHQSGYFKHSVTNEVDVSDSMSSGSDCEREKRIKRKLKVRRDFFCSSCQKHVPAESNRRLQSLITGNEIETRKKLMIQEAAYEIQKWKQKQQQYFLKEWSVKEDTLQKLIASEWSNKIKLIEAEVEHRISECNILEKKLNAAINDVSLKEERLRLRERKVAHIEQEFNPEKEKKDPVSRSKDTSSRSTRSQLLERQLGTEKRKRSELEKEVSKLEDHILSSDEKLKSQTKEIIDLRKKLIHSNDITSVASQKEEYEKKMDMLQERKQYYKAQWLSAITDLHKFHSMHRKKVDEITSSTCVKSPPPYPISVDSPPPSAEVSSDLIGRKLRQLNEERKALLESRLYPNSHSIIRNIDKKIKELLG